MRAWRNWTAQHNTSQRQCITPNAYCCLELNAHGLVLAARSCRDRRRRKQFLVRRFGSQDVEDIFRILRSMTSMWHTQTNVSIKELGERLRRVQMINIVKYRNKDTFRFPGKTGAGTARHPARLPSDEMIKFTIEGARTSASAVLERLGIPKDMQSFQCSVIATGDPNWEDLLVDGDGDDVDGGEGEGESEGEDEDEDDDHDEPARGSSVEACRRVFEADELFINYTGKLQLRDSKRDKGTYLVRYKGRVHRVDKAYVLSQLTDGRYRGTTTRMVRYRERQIKTTTRRSTLATPSQATPMRRTRRRRTIGAAAPATTQAGCQIAGNGEGHDES